MPARFNSLRPWIALGASLALPFAAAAVGGRVTTQNLRPWYNQLQKPAATPPGSFIGAVWSVLYTLMAGTAWLVWRRGDAEPSLRRAAQTSQRWFAIQLLLNLGWSVAFFGRRSPRTGLSVIALLWCAILGWMRSTARVSPLAAGLQLPHLAWVTFAAYLNAQIYRLNAETPAPHAE